jgi:hypothetical protein
MQRSLRTAMRLLPLGSLTNGNRPIGRPCPTWRPWSGFTRSCCDTHSHLKRKTAVPAPFRQPLLHRSLLATSGSTDDYDIRSWQELLCHPPMCEDLTDRCEGCAKLGTTKEPRRQT